MGGPDRVSRVDMARRAASAMHVPDTNVKAAPAASVRHCPDTL